MVKYGGGLPNGQVRGAVFSFHFKSLNDKAKMPPRSQGLYV